MLQGRRRVLLAVGGGAAAIAGLSSAVAVTVGASTGNVNSGRDTRRKGGAYADRDASFAGPGLDDLGASGVADTPSQAAAAAFKATPRYPNPLSRDPVTHLLRRIAFGPTQANVAAVRQLGIDAWIEQQLNPQSIPDPAGDVVVAAYPTLPMSTAALKALPRDGNNRVNAQTELGRATIGRQIFSERQLFEVMVDFWANHLNVNNPLDGGEYVRSVYDREVIRAHALGKFRDMLQASGQSPAMLRRLNNDQSDKRNVNENYGRELLELHTVGVDGGYTEVDVRQSAYILTGRTITRNTDMFTYDASKHYTGAVKVLGFNHPNKSAAEGLAVGNQYIDYLAMHESTAQYICRKLCVRFVCDRPPPTLVMRLAKEYLANGTAIVPVLKLLFRSLEFWIATGLGTRPPLESMVATSRVLGVTPGDPASTAKALDAMYNAARDFGQAPLAHIPPDGYPLVAEAWNSAYVMLSNWNTQRTLVQGGFRGLVYSKPEQLVPNRPPTVGGYVDALAARVLLQPLAANERAAILTFLNAGDGSKATDSTLGGKVGAVVALLLNSAVHALR